MHHPELLGRTLPTDTVSLIAARAAGRRVCLGVPWAPPTFRLPTQQWAAWGDLPDFLQRVHERGLSCGTESDEVAAQWPSN